MAELQAFADGGRHVLKKQRVSADKIHQQLDLLLREVESTQQRLVDKQHEYRRKQSKRQEDKTPASSSARSDNNNAERDEDGDNQAEADAEDTGEGDTIDGQPQHADEDDAEQQDAEVEAIIQECIRRVRLLSVDKVVGDELKAIHVVLSKYGKRIDKTFCNDISRACRSHDFDHALICRLVAEHLYLDGQIDAADAICKEAQIDLPATYRECFKDLHEILQALERKDLAPALAWARKHRIELRELDIDLEFELVRLHYVEMLVSGVKAVDAVSFASTEFAYFHETHAKEVGRLVSCVLFKDRLQDSPYKDFFHDHRWEDIRNSVISACCRLRRVPPRSYLQTCISTGVAALPAIRKLLALMDGKLADWGSMEELPVQIPIDNAHRFHTVFACPVSKEESTPTNPPVMLKCGHVICKSCVKRVSFNMTRRFKCPTCPVEQSESETRELIF